MSKLELLVLQAFRQGKLVQTNSCSSSLDSFCELFGEEYCSQLVKMHYRNKDLKLSGFISVVETSKLSIKVSCRCETLFLFWVFSFFVFSDVTFGSLTSFQALQFVCILLNHNNSVIFHLSPT